MAKICNTGKKRISVQEAARRLSLSPMLLSLLLRENRLPQIGVAICLKLHSKRKSYKYIIYEDAVESFLKNEVSLAIAN